MSVKKGIVAAVRSVSTLPDLTTVTVSVAFSSSMTHTVKVALIHHGSIIIHMRNRITEDVYILAGIL